MPGYFSIEKSTQFFSKKVGYLMLFSLKSYKCQIKTEY